MGSAFRDQNWAQRFTVLGDTAEQKFGEYMTEQKRAFERYGLERPSVQVHRLTPFVRYTPDFVTSDRLIEVQGHGRGNATKMKDDKLDALFQWEAHSGMPVWLFLWNSSREVRFLIPLVAYEDALCKHGVPGVFDPDTSTPKPYRQITDDFFDPWLV